MFGRKARELKKIRKELRGIRLSQYEDRSEPSGGKQANNPSGCMKVVFIFVIIFVLYAYFQDGSSDNTNVKNETSTSVLSEKSNNNTEENAPAPTPKPVEKTKTEINLDVLEGTPMSSTQKMNLADALEGFGTTLKSVEKIGNWSLGERYHIEVGWYDYYVYFNGQKVQSINNTSNEVVYGSRPSY
jgi:hypothetical protein